MADLILFIPAVVLYCLYLTDGSSRKKVTHLPYMTWHLKFFQQKTQLSLIFLLALPSFEIITVLAIQKKKFIIENIPYYIFQEVMDACKHFQYNQLRGIVTFYLSSILTYKMKQTDTRFVYKEASGYRTTHCPFLIAPLDRFTQHWTKKTAYFILELSCNKVCFTFQH